MAQPKEHDSWIVEHWPKATIFLAIYTFILL